MPSMRLACSREMIGDSVLSDDQVGPGRSSSKYACRWAMNGSMIERWINNREPDTHTCPAFPVMARATVGAVLAMSGTSAKTSFGLLPPSSRVTGFGPTSAQVDMMLEPVAVEPVKVTLPTRG